MKTFLIILVLAAAGVAWYALPRGGEDAPEAVPEATKTAVPGEPAGTESAPASEVPTETAQPVPETAAPSQPEGPKTYTMAEVVTHNGSSSCWTVVRGAVYDVTAFIEFHPGGPERILSLCGRDGTADFTDEHSGDKRPENTLASFKIGELAR